MVSDKKIFSMFFPCISLCKTCDPMGPGHYWPEDHNLNKLGRGPLRDAIYQLPRLYALGLMVSDKKIFHVFSL